MGLRPLDNFNKKNGIKKEILAFDLDRRDNYRRLLSTANDNDMTQRDPVDFARKPEIIKLPISLTVTKLDSKGPAFLGNFNQSNNK